MLLVRRSMELVKRRQKLGGEFTGGNGEIQKGRNAMDADTSNWPPDERPDQIQPEFRLSSAKRGKPRNYLSHWHNSTCHAPEWQAHSLYYGPTRSTNGLAFGSIELHRPEGVAPRQSTENLLYDLCNCGTLYWHQRYGVR